MQYRRVLSLGVSVAAALAVSGAQAAPFTFGNLVVHRVGDGAGSLVNTGSAVFLDEYTPAGTLVQSIAMPTTVNGANRQLIASGTATSEGLLSRSADGNYLVLSGYGRDLGGVGSLAGTASATVNRIVGRVAADGTFNTTTALTDHADGNNPRSVASTNGTDLWVTGGAGGIRYTTLGSTTSTQISTTVTNLRQAGIFGGQLHISTSSGSAVRIGTVGTGTPTTSGQVITNLPGFPTTGSPYVYVFLDLDAGVAGADTLYVADDGPGGGILKFSLVAGNWTANGLIGADADDYRGLTGTAAGSTVTLYSTRLGGGGAVGGGQLVSLVDNSGYNASITGTPTLLATAANNTAFRGVAFAPGQPPIGPIMRITEYMYDGANLELIEFTNVGDAATDLTGWSFDDDSRIVGTQDLSAYAIVQPGESVILAESSAANFRTAWGLCAGVKVIGNLAANLGRNDEINLFAAGGALVDRLTYGDQTFPGTIRTQLRSGYVSSAGLGANNPAAWTLSTVGDAEDSVASTGADQGSPGKSTRALFDYDPCVGTPGTPTIAVDVAQTSPYLDLNINGAGAASGVLGDPSDPAANVGIGFTFADSDGDPNLLTITATSTNAAVVPPAGLALTGTGTTRNLRITPSTVGTSVVTVRAQDTTGKIGTYVISYAASAASINPTTTRFHTGASDASTAIGVDTQHMLVADDENQVLRLYRRDLSGLHLAGFDFTSSLALTDLSGGLPREVDLEGSTRNGNRIYWTGSHGNQATGSFNARPNRRRVFAAEVSGSGALTSLAYVGRYDFLAQDLVAWDQANGHGLGADALGFAASTAPNVSPEIPSGFNVEALTIAPDGSTAYFAFRAPRVPIPARDQALVVQVLNFDTLVTGAAPGSLPQGSATFGAPILLNLGNRSIRSIERTAGRRYVIIAGPAGAATGTPPDDFRLYEWTGVATDAPIERIADLTALQTGGSFETLVALPETLGPATPIPLAVDNGDTIYYANGIIAKDLGERRHAKFRTEQILVDFPPLPDDVFAHGFEDTVR